MLSFKTQHLPLKRPPYFRQALRQKTMAAVPQSVKRLQLNLDLEPQHRPRKHQKLFFFERTYRDQR